MDKLFPEYLNQGSKGPAVAFLQALLKAYNYNAENIIIDGDYGPETVKGVMALQDYLDIEQDGNFGPATRKAWVEQETYLDINSIPRDAFRGEEHYIGP